MPKKAATATTPWRERGQRDPPGVRPGLDGGDLGFPPHSQLSHLRYDPDPIYTTITICVVIKP
jgi:hypothetical protein